MLNYKTTNYSASNWHEFVYVILQNNKYYALNNSSEFWIPYNSTDVSYKIVSKSNILYFTVTYDIWLKIKWVSTNLSTIILIK